jgi:pSer/pThr/pTyr-binding forkhead associated (FHA) protein
MCGTSLINEPILTDSDITKVVDDIKPDYTHNSLDSIEESDRSANEVINEPPKPTQLILQVKPGCLIKVKSGDVIGRGAVGSDYLLDFPKVSRYHAKISYQNGQWFLEDNNSTNGTYFEGKRVKTLVLSLGLSFFLSGTCNVTVVSC